MTEVIKRDKMRDAMSINQRDDNIGKELFIEFFKSIFDKHHNTPS